MGKYSHLLLLVVLLQVHSLMDYCSANTNFNSDRSSLFTLKSQITSDPQNILTKNWTPGSNVCSWIGVTCDSRYNRVTKLNISSMGLVGTIPPEIGNLSFLVSLNVSENSFHGPIPSSIFNISSLEVLELKNNSLSSSLPLDMCKHNLQRLKRLRLSFNDLYGEIPSNLEHCLQLDYLSLYSNNFSGDVPREIGNMTMLQSLYLGANKLTGNIPREIGGLTILQFLDMSSNNFSGDVPREIGNLTMLQLLGLGSNNFSGDVPREIGNLTMLQLLDLGSNNLTGYLDHFLPCNCTNLLLLDLSLNNLSGTIPPCLIQNFKDLKVLNLEGNNISGRVLDNFSPNCSLRTLHLSDNNLVGDVPLSLEYCSSLTFMNVGNNQIEDSFPCMLPSSLRVLVLRSNRFHGEVTCHKKSWPNLQIIDIASNNFSGYLNPFNFSIWRGMMLDSNATLPRSNLGVDNYYRDEVTLTIKGVELKLVKIWPEFTSIDFSCNHFQGDIPQEIGELCSLYLINLSHNTLTGAIPKSFSKLRLLGSLDLSMNQLTGEIPQEIAGLTFLQVMNVSHNNLVGKIPIGTQIQSFSPDCFEGNSGLCGLPLNINCSNNTSSSAASPSNMESHKKEIEWDYVFAAAGYAVGLGIISWLLLFCRSFRETYFEKIDDVFEKIINRSQRKKRRDRARRALRNRVRRQ